MSTIKQYINVYFEFVRTCISESMSFRLHFVLLIFMDLVFYFVAITSVHFVFDHIGQIGPWGRDQFLFFIAFILAVDHLHMTFISENFWEFAEDLRMGKLDFTLLKPLSPIFTIFFRRMRPASLLNGFATGGLLIYYGQNIGFSWGQWLALPFLVLFAFVFIASLEILISLAMFWVIDGFGINFLRMQFQQLARWPDFIYKYYARKFFTFVFPMLLVGSGPVRLILDKQANLFFAAVVAMGLIWLAISLVWRFAVRRYESASS